MQHRSCEVLVNETDGRLTGLSRYSLHTGNPRNVHHVPNNWWNCVYATIAEFVAYIVSPQRTAAGFAERLPGHRVNSRSASVCFYLVCTGSVKPRC